MNALVIIQARMGSRRFPGKSLSKIDGKPILWYLFEQLSHCKSGITAILATTTEKADDPLAAYGHEQGWNVFRGHPEDVLKRYFDAAVAYGAKPKTVIVRVTGDDIWPDPNMIDAAVNLHASFAGCVEVVSTARGDDLPYGVYVETYTFRTLEKAFREATQLFDREHVSPYIFRDQLRFPRIEIKPTAKLVGPALSIDIPEDLERNRNFYQHLNKEGAEAPYHVADVVLFSIVAPKISLARPHLRFANDVLAYSRDPEFARSKELAPMSTIGDAEEFIQHLIDDNAAGRRDYWMIIDSETDRAIGTIGFIMSPTVRRGSADFGFGLSHRYWGTDAFVQVGRKVIEYGFGELGLDRIQTTTHTSNTISIDSMKALGFKQEAVLHNFYDNSEAGKDGLLLYLTKNGEAS